MKDFEELKKFKGQGVQLRMRITEDKYFGNLDDGEEYDEILRGVEDKFCVLQNIYLVSSERFGRSELELKYIRGTQDGTDVLFPLHYWYCSTFHLRTAATYPHTRIEKIIGSDGNSVDIKDYYTKWVDDGYANVTPDDYYSDSDKYPKLAKYGCVYVPGRRAITGDLEKLLADAKPMW